MSTLRSFEPFVQFYLDGILNTGLLKPLVQYSLEGGGASSASKVWYQMQIEGQSPQAALKSFNGFPESLSKLLVLGFEKSSLDLVLSDILKAYKTFPDDKSCDAAT